MSETSKLSNLRLNVIKLVLSDKTGRIALLKMVEACSEGRRLASEIGRKKAEAKQ